MVNNVENIKIEVFRQAPRVSGSKIYNETVDDDVIYYYRAKAVGTKVVPDSAGGPEVIYDLESVYSEVVEALTGEFSSPEGGESDGSEDSHLPITNRFSTGENNRLGSLCYVATSTLMNTVDTHRLTSFRSEYLIRSVSGSFSSTLYSAIAQKAGNNLVGNKVVRGFVSVVSYGSRFKLFFVVVISMFFTAVGVKVWTQI